MPRSRSLVSSILSHRELPAQRACLDLALAERGAAALVTDLEALFASARDGASSARVASVAVASWVTSHANRGSGAIDVVRGGAAEADAPLTRALFADGPARASLARGGRLAEVCIPARQPFAVFCTGAHVQESSAHELASLHADELFTPVRFCICSSAVCLMRTYFAAARPSIELFRRHPNPVFVARLLDTTWLRLRDVLMIASRRPITPAIAWTIATRDRWFGQTRVREALGSNPFTPAPLVLALIPSLSRTAVRLLAETSTPDVRRAAVQWLERARPEAVPM